LFGTAAMMEVDDFDDVVRFVPFTAGEYRIALDGRLMVDTFYRDVEMPVGMLAKRHGEENLSQAAKNVLAKNEHAWVPVRMAIEPNPDHRPGSPLRAQLKSKFVVYEIGADTDEKFLDEGGFNEFPVMAPRWDVTGTDIYGKSPGMDVLGDVKQLQLEEKRKAQAIDKMASPPMVAPAGLENKFSSTIPGQTTYVDEQNGTKGFRPAYQVDPRVAELKDDIRAIEQRIRRGLYEDLFLLFTNSDRRNITATEVVEKQGEKLLMLGPVLERLNNELLDKLIDRTFAIMLRQGLIPPAPPEIAGIELNVDYVSVLHQAQRSVATTGINSLTGFVAGMEQIAPGSRHKLNSDAAIDEYAQSIGTSPNLIRTNEEANEIRRGEAEAIEEAAAAERNQATVAAAADAAKKLAGANLETDNALSRSLR
ncbi:MAG: portal protein, partial [Alphaproteobacteria bacterium]